MFKLFLKISNYILHYKKAFKSLSKEDLIHAIETSGCRMLKDKLDGTETKDEIVAYLEKCKCPTLKKLLNK